MGRNMSDIGRLEEMTVEAQSIGHELRPHDEHEVADLDLLQRTLRALGATAAPHCTPKQAELWRWAHRTMQRLVDANREFEDPKHVELLDLRGSVMDVAS